MAYRGAGRAPRAKPEGGLVEDVVQQFADRFAYARELVQNAIDAGATRIDVTLSEDDARLHVKLSDDGKGMTIDVIRGPLLTVFSSTKEDDTGKIGKYGVGFKSVLAVDPTEVVVETHRAEGAYRVRLFRDHTFEIEALDPRPGSGTSVELVIDAEGSARRDHASRLRAALLRWCRHIRVPLSLTKLDHTTEKLNVPLALRAPVVVELERDGMRAIVGPSLGTDLLPGDPGTEGSGDFAGFYGHGLTMLECDGRPPTIPGLRFKVDGPGLGCTISRDDVRRDAAFRKAMKLVERLAGSPLDDALDAALASAAKAYGERGGDALDAYLPLLQAAAGRERPDASLALLEPWDNAWCIERSKLMGLSKKGRVWAETARSRLTARLAREGHAIMRVDEAGSVLGRARIGAHSPRATFAILSPATDVSFEAALDTMKRVLSHAGRRVDDVSPFEVTEGTFKDSAVFVRGGGGARTDEWLLPTDANADGRRLLVERSLVEQVARHPHLERAAALVARIALLETGGAISALQNERILEASIGGSA
ncbi:MAG: hypothetical protein HOW73_26590 [Polyangiaceae bacterium]|nr:hypothetical protein [Polyangiaceae bacterium]